MYELNGISENGSIPEKYIVISDIKKWISDKARCVLYKQVEAEAGIRYEVILDREKVICSFS